MGSSSELIGARPVASWLQRESDDGGSPGLANLALFWADVPQMGQGMRYLEEQCRSVPHLGHQRRSDLLRPTLMASIVSSSRPRFLTRGRFHFLRKPEVKAPAAWASGRIEPSRVVCGARSQNGRQRSSMSHCEPRRFADSSGGKRGSVRTP